MQNRFNLKNYFDQARYILLLGFAFSFPFGNIYGTVIIIMLAMLWLAGGNIIQKIKAAFSNPFFLTYSSLYFIQFPGLINTEDFGRAFYLIRLNASMLLLPLFFSAEGYLTDLNRRKNILLALVAGCFTVTVVCIIKSSIRYINSGDLSVFFYNELASPFYHPGFLSIQISVCLTALLLQLGGICVWFSKFRRIHLVLLSFWFAIFIGLLSSKIGLIVLILILTVTAIYGWINTAGIYLKLVLVMIPVIAVFFMFNTGIVKRIELSLHTIKTRENLNESEESTALRINAIKSTAEIIKTHWLTGVGTGDVWPTLRRYYFVDSKPGCLKEKVIPHNQYLNTLAKNGIAGLLLLFTLLLFPLIVSFRKSQWLHFSFMILIALTCMVEDVFEVQNGVVFTSFFYSYLFILMYPGKEKY